MSSYIYTFNTIESPTSGLYTDKGSKFISHAFPIKEDADIKYHLNTLKKKYYDARHHVYAYMLTHATHIIERSNDDGEPTNSSGIYVLGQIKSFKLSNTLIIVVRYFGGTKLGIPGLNKAYKNASIDALSKAKIIEKFLTNRYQITCSYKDLDYFLKIAKDYDIELCNKNFTDNCNIIANIKIIDETKIIQLLSTNNNFLITKANDDENC